MLYFDKALVGNARNARTHGKWWGEVTNARRFADAEEARVMSVNEAAIIPQDAWREMDTITKELMRGDGGETFMEDLLPLAKAVNIGKLVAIKRSASDAGHVIRSLSGQEPTPTDKTDYKYEGTPIPIFSSSYHRNFREWEALSYEGFDALFDDQRNVLFNLRRDNALYVLNGDASLSVEAYKSYGVLNHPNSKSINLGSATGGANIDLTTATPQQMVDFFTGNGPLNQLLDANFIRPRVRIYVSPDIMRNMDKPLSSVEGYKGGTVRRFLEETSRVESIKQTFELTGNQFFGFVPRSDYIRPIIGMATSTVAKPRLDPRANYVFDVWNAMGIEIIADYNGRSGVFHSVVVN